MDNQALKKILLLLAVLFLLLACELPALVPVSSEPDFIPIETIIAGTAVAAQMQTAVMLPSPTHTITMTASPTSTPTDTPTATATIIFTIPPTTKPFEPHSVGANCQLVEQQPLDNTKIASGESFDATWTVKNTGNDIWYGTDVDFKYSSGTDMHNRDIFDLPNSVGADSEITLTVPMVAPGQSGSYTSTWVLAQNKTNLCKVSITIIVE